MNDIIPEDTTRTAPSKDVITLRNPPWQTPLRSGRPPMDKLPVERLTVHQYPTTALLPRRNSACAWTEADTADIIIKQARSARGSRTELAHAVGASLERNPELRAYRRRTVSMLRRYLRYSLETGRVPSLLGGEYFRTGVTSYGVVTFEDRVIFVHDMERCLHRLSEFSLQIIARHTLQEHDLESTARLLQCNEKTIRRAIPVVLDQLSEILLEVGLLEAMIPTEENSCQGGQSGEILASDCEESEKVF
jgi:hypothetical protein